MTPQSSNPLPSGQYGIWIEDVAAKYLHTNSIYLNNGITNPYVQIDPSSNPQLFLTDGSGTGFSVNTSITNGSITLLDETTTPNTSNELTYSTITLTDGTTTNIIDKNGYTTRNSVQNSTHYLNFSDSSSTGTGAIQKTAGISCNPSTNIITATTFVGDLSGNATTASEASFITITDSTSPVGTFYPTFVNSDGTQKSVSVDTTGLSYSPSSNTLTTTNFAGTATKTTNIAGGLGGSIPYQTAVDTTALLANGTAGQFLKSNGTTLAPSWDTPVSSTINITDTNTNGTYFPTFVSASGSGQTLRADTTTTPLAYNIATNINELKVSQATAGTNQLFSMTSINTALGSGIDRYSQLQLYSGNNTTGKTSSQLYAQVDSQNFSNCDVKQDIVNLSHTFVDAENTYTSGIKTYDDATFTGVPVSVLYANFTAPSDNFAGIRCKTQPSQSVEIFAGSTIDVAVNIASFNTGAISLIPAVSFTEQLTLPTTRPIANFTNPTLSCDFGNKSTGIFSGVLTANMTGATFTNGRTGGQYVIYLTATGGTRTIATSLTNATINKTNYTTAISVSTTSYALLTITFDGTRYLIAGSAYN